MSGLPLQETLFASTLPGLEGALEAEAREALPQAQVARAPGGVELTGPAGLHRAANLGLALASRVLLRLAGGPAGSARALEATLRGVDVAGVWDGRAPLALATAVTSRAGGLPERVVEAAARAVWPRAAPARAGALLPDADAAEAAGVTLLVRVDGGEASVSVDTSGAPLHRRGYRQEVGKAPLRETLAAGILRLAGHAGTAPLLDPMCGSGTFLIEGGWASRRHAPGLLRAFAFEGFPGHDARAWEEERAAARARVLPAPRAGLHGRDLNAGALGVARRNARRAGLTLDLVRADVRTLVAPPGPAGLVVCNPPYGKRVGEGEDLDALYAALGRALAGPLAGWRVAVLAPEEPRWLDLLRGSGLARELALRNGGLRCRVLMR